MTFQGALSPRDLAILQLLDRTPTTTELIQQASVTFEGEPFQNPRRVRERLQSLAGSGLIRAFPVTQGIGGPRHWFKLTREGFLLVRGVDAELPHRSWFEEIPPSRFEHTAVLAEMIVHTMVAAHRFRINVVQFHGDGGLALETGESKQIPDCHFGLEYAGRYFNILFELDLSTEPLSSERLQSLQTKIRGYEAYQQAVWETWKKAGGVGSRPYFRVVFLTRHAERATHILWLARQNALNPSRRLCYAGTQAAFLAEEDALREPLFNDHFGNWQSLSLGNPTTAWRLEPIRVTPPRRDLLGV